MRSTADVSVLQRPPWWTPIHGLLLLAVALAGTMAVLAWVVSLRRRVQGQANLLRESEERFRYMAQHDALTGLANRPVLEDRLNVALQAAKRRQAGLTLMMLDLDKFKEINDGQGHHAGDEVLRATATRLAGLFRKSDTVARLGGDEFVALLPDMADRNAAGNLAAKVVAALSVPISFAGHELQISVSLGVCVATAHELEASSLMKAVDAALYRAKARGRNCFEIQGHGSAAA
jgi:diguanylate cyclase (GGDEF)-like protein